MHKWKSYRGKRIRRLAAHPLWSSHEHVQSLAEEEEVTLPAAAAAGQKLATKAMLDTAPEKTEKTATDTVQLAETESDTAPESDNKVLEQNSGVLQKHWSTPVQACQMSLLHVKH